MTTAFGIQIAITQHNMTRLYDLVMAIWIVGLL